MPRRRATERWAAVIGFEGWYEVSDAGRVRSYVRSPLGALMHPYAEGPKRYPFVILKAHDKPRRRYVHHLVAEAFLSRARRADQTQVSHVNGNGFDNRAENLRWATPSENLLHGTRVLRRGRLGEQHPFSKLTEEQVLQIRDRRRRGESASRLATEFGLSSSHVQNIVRRSSWGHV